MLRAVIIQNAEKKRDCEEQKKHKYKMVTKNLKELNEERER